MDRNETSQPGPPHMSPERFRAEAIAFADWINDYGASLEGRPVTPLHGPGAVAGALPLEPPEAPGDDGEWDAIRADLDTLITPELLHWQSPRFFGYFPCNASGPATLATLVMAGLNVNGMSWATSPAATELETRVLDWGVRLFGLPERFASSSPTGGGCIQGTASESTLVALLAGRDRARDAGAPIDALRVYTSTQAHSSVVKAAMIAGLALGPDDRSQFRLIETDAGLRMDPAALEHTIRADLEAGAIPCAVVGTLGTTGTEAVDPFDQIADVVDGTTDAARPRPWLHADAAFTGAALICPEYRHLARGLERFDSVCLNPHKWLLTNFDCDLFWTADRRAITRSLSITPEYLRNDETDAGAVLDYRDWQIPLGRAFRALKFWFVLRHYGAEGLRAHIRAHVALAEAFENDLRRDGRFEIVGERATALVCFRLDAGDEPTERVYREVNRRGRVYLSQTRAPLAPGREPSFVLRLAIGSPRTQRRHIDEAFNEIARAADAALG